MTFDPMRLGLPTPLDRRLITDQEATLTDDEIVAAEALDRGWDTMLSGTWMVPATRQPDTAIIRQLHEQAPVPAAQSRRIWLSAVRRSLPTRSRSGGWNSLGIVPFSLPAREIAAVAAILVALLGGSLTNWRFSGDEPVGFGTASAEAATATATATATTTATATFDVALVSWRAGTAQDSMLATQITPGHDHCTMTDATVSTATPDTIAHGG